MDLPEIALKQLVIYSLGAAFAGGMVTLGGLIIKKFWYAWGGHDRRRNEEPNWFQKFIDATTAHSEATLISSQNFAKAVQESTEKTIREIHNLAGAIAGMTKYMEGRTDTALEQHDIILGEIKKLGLIRRDR